MLSTTTQSFKRSIISISQVKRFDQWWINVQKIDSRFLEIRDQTEMNKWEWILFPVNIFVGTNFVKKQFRKHRCTDCAFLFTSGQANINALGLPLLPVRERTARALSKKAKCQWPASLHLWSRPFFFIEEFISPLWSETFL